MDSANTARAFLRDHDISQQDVDLVWTAIALHTTPGIPQYMHPVVALVNAGVVMDVLGIGYSEFWLTRTARQWCETIHERRASKRILFSPFTTG